jgi:hypothetical protein
MYIEEMGFVRINDSGDFEGTWHSLSKVRLTLVLKNGVAKDSLLFECSAGPTKQSDLLQAPREWDALCLLLDDKWAELKPKPTN